MGSNGQVDGVRGTVRRRWPEAEKARIVQQSLEPGARVCDVARRNGVATRYAMAITRRIGQIPKSATIALRSLSTHQAAPRNQETPPMPTGTVKWFNATKGYGFIAPEDGSKDVFVHVSAVERAGLGTLREGQRVTFEVRPGRDGRTSAEELSAVE